MENLFKYTNGYPDTWFIENLDIGEDRTEINLMLDVMRREHEGNGNPQAKLLNYFNEYGYYESKANNIKRIERVKGRIKKLVGNSIDTKGTVACVAHFNLFKAATDG